MYGCCLAVSQNIKGTGHNMSEELKREDYEEPRCVICDPATGQPARRATVPLDRIVEKLDEYCGKKEFAAAERHLLYWLEEAKFQGDLRGEFSLRNELMGFYRKQEVEDKAIENATEALKLMAVLGNDNTISAGTCFVNCGTVYDNFGYPEKALPYFEKAQAVYELNLTAHDERLAGLYNNMGLVLSDLRRFGEADRLFHRALEVMENVESGKLEMAITYLNMADAVEAEHGMEKAEAKINQYLDLAYGLLSDESNERNAYFRYVLERCTPAYYCYGHFEQGEKLEALMGSVK